MAKDPHGVIDGLEELEGSGEVEAPTTEAMASSESDDWKSPPAEVTEEIAEPTNDDGGQEEGKAEAKAEEAKPAEKPEEKPEKPPEGYVQKGALDAERHANKELKAENRQLLATVQRWLDSQTAAAQPKQEEAKAEDDDPMPAEDDYLGQITWLKNRVMKYEQRDQERAAEERQHSEQVQRWEGAKNAVAGYWNEAATEQPDLNPIWGALKASMAQEMYEAYGIRDEQGLRNSLSQWENRLIADCFNNQKPIDVVVRGMAKARGITAESIARMNGKAEEAAAAPGEGQEKQAQERDEQGRFKAEQEKNERLRESQERNGSLSQASGAPVEKMSAKEFSKLSEDEQIRMMQKLRNTPQGRDFERELGFV